jgi:tetratricopeptide (TPR) repeat protein
MAIADLENYQEAIDAYEETLKISPTSVNTLYNLACVYSLNNDLGMSIDSLRKAIDNDPKYKDMARMDPDFDNIKEHPDFKAQTKS